MVKASFPSAGFWMALVILTMTIRQLSLWKLGEDAAHGRIGDMVLLLVVGLWFGGRCLMGRFAMIRNRLDLAVILLLLFFVASIFWADNIQAGGIRSLKLLRNGMLYFVLADYLSTDFPNRYKNIAICVVVTGLFQSLAYLVAIGQNGGLTALSALLQADSVASNDPILAVVRKDQGGALFLQGVASWLPLGMFLGFSIQRTIRSPLVSWGNWVLICSMGVLTLLSGTRAAMVALAAGVVVIFLLSAKDLTVEKLLAGGLGAAILLVGAWVFNLQAFVGSRMSVDTLQYDPSVTARLTFYKFALDRFSESPWVGVGVANIFPDGLTAVHNAYLQVLAEVGVVGGLIFLWILALWTVYLMSASAFASRWGDRMQKRFAVSILGGSVFFFVYFLVGHDLGSSEPWLLMSMTSALHNSVRIARDSS